MAEALVLKFDGRGMADYEAVDKLLGIDTSRSDSDWPDGLQWHGAGMAEGALVVLEVWESQAAQGRFMESRLGPALQEAGMPAPSMMLWTDLAINTVISR